MRNFMDSHIHLNSCVPTSIEIFQIILNGSIEHDSEAINVVVKLFLVKNEVITESAQESTQKLKCISVLVFLYSWFWRF